MQHFHSKFLFSDIEDAEKAGSESRSATSEYENMVNLVKLDTSELDDYRIVQSFYVKIFVIYVCAG